MASNNRSNNGKVEAYARALIDAGRGEDRANADLRQWEHASKFSPEVLETLATMRASGDDGLIKAVSRRYKEILDSGDGTVSVSVTTSVPMDDALRQRVVDKTTAELGAPVYLVEHVDPSILGGIIIEARGKRHDASIRAQLAHIRKQLASTFIGSDEQ